MRCVLKGSFENSIKSIITGRQEDKECFKILCPLFLASALFADTNAFMCVIVLLRVAVRNGLILFVMRIVLRNALNGQNK